MSRCNYCNSDVVIKFGSPNGRQRFKCKDCGRISFKDVSRKANRTKLDKAYEDYCRYRSILSISENLGYKTPSLIYKWMNEPYISNPKFQKNPFIRVGITKNKLRIINERIKEIGSPLFIKFFKSTAKIYYWPEQWKEDEVRNLWRAVEIYTLKDVRDVNRKYKQQIFSGTYFTLIPKVINEDKLWDIVESIDKNVYERISSLKDMQSAEFLEFFLSNEILIKLNSICTTEYTARVKKDRTVRKKRKSSKINNTNQPRQSEMVKDRPKQDSNRIYHDTDLSCDDILKEEDEYDLAICYKKP